MDATKVFDDLTWANVVIEQDELKAIQEFSIKELKHKDLHVVCSQLKIKGVKNNSKDSMLKKIVSVENDVELIITPPRKEPQCPSRLLNILFSDRFSEGLAQLGNVATRLNLMQAKHPTINYFGKVSKKPSSAMMNYMTTCNLRMMRSLVTCTMLTFRK